MYIAVHVRYIVHVHVADSVLTFPISAGMFIELVANPMPNTKAAGFPTKRATRASNSLWMFSVPIE